MTALPLGGAPDGGHLLHDVPACSGLSPAAPASQPSLHSSSAESLHHVNKVPCCSSQAAFVGLSVPDQLLVCILHDQHDMSR